nr:MAG TPA: hypothetical protein [Caudoviricetes sp.]
MLSLQQCDHLQEQSLPCNSTRIPHYQVSRYHQFLIQLILQPMF